MSPNNKIIADIVNDIIHSTKFPKLLNECLASDKVLNAMVTEAQNPSNIYSDETEDDLVNQMYEDYINGNLDEGLLGALIGGVAGLTLGTKVGKLICKVLGIEENGPLGRLLTSKVTATAIGIALGKGK